MPLIQPLGIQGLGVGLRVDQRLVNPSLLAQLVHRQIGGMADHLETQARQMLQLLRHGAGGSIRGVQRTVIQVARAGRLLRSSRRKFGDQHRRFDSLGQHAQQQVCQLRLPRPEQQHTHGIEQRMEQRQLNQAVFSQAQRRDQPLDQPGQRQ